jgi:DNA processing protein
MNMTLERQAWLFLNRIPYLSPVRFQKLLEAFGSAEAVLRQSASDLEKHGIQSGLAGSWAGAFRDPNLKGQAEAEITGADGGLFRIVLESDADYPEAMRPLTGRPMVLYIQGRWPLSQALHLGIVGTRHPSAYGREAAKWLTDELVDRGVATVSGLAGGIDRCVHERTLARGGWTIAALGHGLQHVFPRENAGLFEQMSQGGTLISEFPYIWPPQAQQFPRRNRIIAGLSRGVLVVEAGRRSGALITARNAAEIGRDVFVVPGSIFEEQSRGCHRLLRHGAMPVENAGQILEALGATPVAPRAKEIPAEPDFKNCSVFEKQVLEALFKEPVSVDEMAVTLRAPIDQLANTLLSLELRGMIKSMPGQRYGYQNH